MGDGWARLAAVGVGGCRQARVRGRKDSGCKEGELETSEWTHVQLDTDTDGYI